MGIEVTEEWVRQHYKNMGKPVPDYVEKALKPAARLPEIAAEKPKRQRKYNNKPTTVAGKTFDSKHEAEVFLELQGQLSQGNILGLMTQVPFQLTESTKYIADFVTLKRDGTYDVLDAKSPATRQDKTYRLKYRLMKDLLGITIKEV